MSYYAWISLTLENATVFQARDIEKRLAAFGAIGKEFTPRHGLHFDACCEIDGWYPTCEPRFMRKISREFPDVHFVVHGEGEVIDGMSSPFWKQHYLDGKCYLNRSAVTLRLFLRHLCGVLKRTSKKKSVYKDRNPVMTARVYRKLESDPVISRPVTTARYPEIHGTVLPMVQKGER